MSDDLAQFIKGSWGLEFAAQGHESPIAFFISFFFDWSFREIPGLFSWIFGKGKFCYLFQLRRPNARTRMYECY